MIEKNERKWKNIKYLEIKKDKFRKIMRQNNTE